MRKDSMESGCAENGSSVVSVLIPFWAGYALGAVVWSIVQHDKGYQAGEHDQAHLQMVQLQNEQIQQQLDAKFASANKLVLKDSDHTYSFDMTSVTGAAEHCSGSYEVRRDAANIMGDIVCTQVVLPGPSPLPTK